MEKYKILLGVKPPYMITKYLSNIVNSSDIIFTHKTIRLQFNDEKKIMELRNKPRKKGGSTITLVF